MENPIRKEQYLLRIAGYDTPIPIKPITREEQLLAAILENGSGADLSVIAPEYDPEDTYSEGDMCTHEGKLYKANQAISTAEEWDETHWTETTVATELADVADPEAIAEAVGDWLGDHVDPDTGYVIDDTLLIEDAAADAKKVGEEISGLKSALAILQPAAVAADVGKVLMAKTVSGGKVTAWELAEIVGGDISTPGVLQRIVAQGEARDYLGIGDVIIIPWTDNTPSTPVTYQYPFVVAHIGDAYDENGVKHEDAVYLQALYATPQDIPFDAAEDYVVNLTEEPNALEGWYYWGVTGTTYTALNLTAGTAIPTTYDSVHRCKINDVNVMRYGYNRWKDSAYRQWLNSGAAKNANWWTAQHDGDVSPSSTYTNKPGFLNGFAADWSAIFKPVKVQTAANTVTDGGVTDVTYDKFFLPSLEQVYGSPQTAGVEGDYWEYWKNVTGLDEPSNGSSTNTNDARKVKAVNAPNGSAVSCRLRSANLGASNYVWFVYTAGYLSNSNAHTACRALPACVIY